MCHNYAAMVRAAIEEGRGGKMLSLFNTKKEQGCDALLYIYIYKSVLQRLKKYSLRGKVTRREKSSKCTKLTGLYILGNKNMWITLLVS